MFDPLQPAIAVAFVRNPQGRLLLCWNEKWRAFSLPMTKPDPSVPSETVAEAAVRAAAEVLRIPCRSVSSQPSKFFRGLQKSERDGQIKDYQFHVVPIEPHPDMTVIAGAGLWLSIHKLRQGEYQPVSPTVEEILKQCAEWKWL